MSKTHDFTTDIVWTGDRGKGTTNIGAMTAPGGSRRPLRYDRMLERPHAGR